MSCEPKTINRLIFIFKSSCFHFFAQMTKSLKITFLSVSRVSPHSATTKALHYITKGAKNVSVTDSHLRTKL